MPSKTSESRLGLGDRGAQASGRAAATSAVVARAGAAVGRHVLDREAHLADHRSAAADRVKNSGSMPRSRRRAIAIERVRWPRPVPFDVTNRIRGARSSRAPHRELLVGVQQGARRVVSLLGELAQGPRDSAVDEHPGRRPRAHSRQRPRPTSWAERRLVAESGASPDRPSRRRPPSSPSYAASPPSSTSRSRRRPRSIGTGSRWARRPPPRGSPRRLPQPRRPTTRAPPRGGVGHPWPRPAAAATSRPSRTTWTNRASGKSRTSVWA